LLASHPVLHAAPALAELSLVVGLLDHEDARTPASLQPIRTLSPAGSLWIEAAVLAGILARTQGIPRPDRRKLLNDALLFLLTEDSGTVLVTRNIRDFDLLLQISPAWPCCSMTGPDAPGLPSWRRLGLGRRAKPARTRLDNATCGPPRSSPQTRHAPAFSSEVVNEQALLLGPG